MLNKISLFLILASVALFATETTHPYITDTGDGIIIIQASFNEPQKDIKIFGRLNGEQTIVRNIKKTEYIAAENKYIYSYSFDKKFLNHADVLKVRFFSKSANTGKPIFTPGPKANNWSETFSINKNDDKKLIVPPIKESAPTNFITAIEFLYNGTNPVQIDVDTTVMDDKKISVIKGKVIDNNNEPITDVKISIKNHLEYGYTESRYNGDYDLAVNGECDYVVEYKKDGFLSIQRTITAKELDFTLIDDVIMTKLSTQATYINLSTISGIQVANGDIVKDSSGERQAKLMFKAGTQALITLEDGSQEPVDDITVRVTEYTVGSNGIKAMPGKLPNTSAYTYAAEFSLDETTSLSGSKVTFSKPVISYTENFINAPVGSIVPVGYYDREKSIWIPMENGIVIKVLDILDGMAILDINGDDIADGNLDSLQITTEELVNLANSYTAGQSLWRVQLDHFTPIDYNWPWSYPSNANGPSTDFVKKTKNKIEKCDEECGSIISVQNQTFREVIPVTGTSFNLNYNSSTVPGYKSNKSVDIDVYNGMDSDDLLRIDLEINVAGRKDVHAWYPSNAPETFTFVWDGLDAYGREVFGEFDVHIKLSYEYKIYYANPTGPRSFANAGDFLRTFPARTTANKSISKDVKMYNSPKPFNLNGWGLDVLHSIDYNNQTIFYGDGNNKTFSQDYTIETIAGNGNYSLPGPDTIPALEADLMPKDLYVMANGEVIHTDGSTVWKITTDGIMIRIAGVFGSINDPDTIPALEAHFDMIYNITGDMYGNVYVADHYNDKIRKITPNGLCITVAGNGGSNRDTTENVLATSIPAPGVMDVTVDKSGNIYYIDNVNTHDWSQSHIRKINPDGYVTTIAGKGSIYLWEDRNYYPAVNANVEYLKEIKITNDGSIIGSSNYNIFKIDNNGLLSKIVNYGENEIEGDFAIYHKMQQPLTTAIDEFDNIYYGGDYSGPSCVRKIDNLNKRVTTVLGPNLGINTELPYINGANPRSVMIDAHGIELHNGNMYIAGYSDRKIYKVSKNDFYQSNTNNIIVPSQNGENYYVFNYPEGQHLYTINHTKNDTIYTFNYDENNHLISIVNLNGKQTHFNRNSDGIVTTIISHNGHVTNINTDENKYITAIQDPESNRYSFEYLEGGLLQKMTDPRGNDFNFTYYPDGRLKRDENPCNGFKEFMRVDSATSFTIVSTSAEGRVKLYRTEYVPNGDVIHTTTLPYGATETTINYANGTKSFISTDGDETFNVYGIHPVWGQNVHIPLKTEIKKPNGLLKTIEYKKSYVFANPNNTLDIFDMYDSTIINDTNISYTKWDGNEKSLSFITGNSIYTDYYDENGNLVRSTTPNQYDVFYTYNTSNLLIDVVCGYRRTSFAYDAQERLISITNPEGHVGYFTSDNNDRYTEIVLPGDRIMSYKFDGNNNVTTITTPENVKHQYTFDENNEMITYTPPTIVEQENYITDYYYNLESKIDSLITADNEVVKYIYLNDGRLDSVYSTNATTKYEYLPNSDRISSVTRNGAQQIIYGYDGANIQYVTWEGEISGGIYYMYNNLLQLKAISAGGYYSFTYNNNGSLINAGPITIERDDVSDKITNITNMNVQTNNTYDLYGDLESYSAKYRDVEIYKTSFIRDNLGRITQKTEKRINDEHIYNYEYSPAGNLITVKKDDNVISDYTYSLNGNRLTHNDIQATYDVQDRLETYNNCEYTYNNSGQLSTKICNGNTDTFVYDYHGNLISAQVDGKNIEYIIDGENRRVGKKVNGSLVNGYIYKDNLNIAFTLDNTGTVDTYFIYGTKENVPDMMNKNGVNYQIISDVNGSVVMVINTYDGIIAQEIAYDEFGNVIKDTNPNFQPFYFAGGLYDTDTKMTRFGARDYDPEIGRWTTKEPLGFTGSSNFYTYCHNDPINFVDNDGYEEEDNNILKEKGTAELKQGLTEHDPGLAHNPTLLDDIANNMWDEMRKKEIAYIGFCPVNPMCNEEKAKTDIAKKLVERVKKNNPELWKKYLLDQKQREEAEKKKKEEEEKQKNDQQCKTTSEN